MSWWWCETLLPSTARELVCLCPSLIPRSKSWWIRGYEELAVSGNTVIRCVAVCSSSVCLWVLVCMFTCMTVHAHYQLCIFTVPRNAYTLLFDCIPDRFLSLIIVVFYKNYFQRPHGLDWVLMSLFPIVGTEFLLNDLTTHKKPPLKTPPWPPPQPVRSERFKGEMFETTIVWVRSIEGHSSSACYCLTHRSPRFAKNRTPSPM